MTVRRMVLCGHCTRISAVILSQAKDLLLLQCNHGAPRNGGARGHTKRASPTARSRPPRIIATMRHSLRLRIAGAVLLFALPLGAAEVRVLAAASLTEALREIGRDYESRSGERVIFSFGGSSTLARQIEAGAPADLFLSADEAKMNALARRGLIDPRTRVSLLSNRLVIVVPRRGGKQLKDPRDLVRFERIAIAEPSTVPAGIYARQYLQTLGIWSALAGKTVPTENVRGALAAVAAGNVDAAIVYRTDARIQKSVRVVHEVSSGPRISYPFAVLAQAGQPQAARRFLAHLRSRAARDIFARHGFDVVR